MPRRQTLAETRSTGQAPAPRHLSDLPRSRPRPVTISPPIIGALIALAGVIAGLWINGDRTERQRRRDLHARALVALLAYGEMPFMIRRRRCEDEERSAERVRLSNHFSDVKAEMTTCEVLLAADGDQKVASAYSELVETARATAGREAHLAWTEPPVSGDSEMNMGDLFDRLELFRKKLATFEGALACATLPRRQRVTRWLRGIDV